LVKDTRPRVSVHPQDRQKRLLRYVDLDLVMSGGTGVSTPRTPLSLAPK